MFATIIINWYKKNKRDLPWRNTNDPYKVWLSEIILQQTRVNQGMEYYLRFVEAFPTITHLANAPEQKVMKLWQGLGYYSRARNLHATAKIIRDEYDGIFPATHHNIITLKGVGDYTAAAIASFCFDECFPVVDGNVYRVLSRVFGIKTPIDSSKGKKEFSELAKELIDKKNPGLYNQAIMEFGALQCKPKNPDCTTCILNDKCIAFEKKLVNKLPVKSKLIKTRTRYFNYFIVNQHEKFLLKKRTEKDIWQNLYDFPLIETEENTNPEKILQSKAFKKIFGNCKLTVRKITKGEKHVLSHQTIQSTFIELHIVSGIKKYAKAYTVVNKQEFLNYPVPRLIEKYLTGLLKE